MLRRRRRRQQRKLGLKAQRPAADPAPCRVFCAWGSRMHSSAWVGGGEKLWTAWAETDLFLKFLRAQVSGGGGTPACTMLHSEPGRPTLTRRSPSRDVSAQNHTFNTPARWPPGATPGGPCRGGFPCPHAAALAGARSRGTKPRVPPLFEIMPPKVPPPAPGMWHTSPDRIARQTGGFHRENKKARKAWDLHGLVCGAGGRNRTGTPCGGGF